MAHEAEEERRERWLQHYLETGELAHAIDLVEPPSTRAPVAHASTTCDHASTTCEDLVCARGTSYGWHR